MAQTNTPAEEVTTKTPKRKVIASVAGTGLGAATSDLIVGGLSDLFNHGDPIPGYLSGWLTIVIPMVVGGLAGYFTKSAPGE